jgi:hypothetical protein
MGYQQKANVFYETVTCRNPQYYNDRIEREPLQRYLPL